MFTAAKIPGSVAIASNPQLDLTRFLPSALARFKECTGIDLAYEKQHGDVGRVDFAHVFSTDSPSKYLVIVNCRSKMDFNDQLIPFCQAFGITPHYGLQRVGNLIIWIIDAPGPHPHLRYESKTMYFAIDFLAKTLAEGGDTDRLKPLYILFSEFWHEKAGLIAGDPACLADASVLSGYGIYLYVRLSDPDNYHIIGFMRQALPELGVYSERLDHNFFLNPQYYRKEKTLLCRKYL